MRFITFAGSLLNFILSGKSMGEPIICVRELRLGQAAPDGLRAFDGQRQQKYS
jgi:hypothetical protein